MSEFITTVEFAHIAKITRQVANRVLKKITDRPDKTWHGHALDVHVIDGRGGKSGKQYVVAVDSLPVHLQDRLNRLQTPVESNLRPLKNKSEKITQELWWSRLLRPFTVEGLTGEERAKLVEEFTEKTDLTDWKGRPITLSRSRIYSRIKKLMLQGLGSQARKARADRGKSRYHVSQKYDKAVPFDDETLAEIAHSLKQEIRGLIKGGAVFNQVRVFARKHLMKETKSRGFIPNIGPSLEDICSVPQQFIRDEKLYKKVHRFKTDKKAHYDASPSIRRDWSKLRPMEIVVADIHHGNWLITREDGTTATAKVIAFMDMATRRIWCDLIFFEGKGGVRNVDVYETLERMWSHPAWGICENLYVDNGSEYNFVEYLNDAMQLAYPAFHHGSSERHSHVIRALPYNAKAKPIEAWFAQLGTYVRHMQGYRGDDPMKPMTDRIGRLPTPTATYEITEAVFFQLLKAYQHFPQPVYGDRSPEQVFQKFVEDGWAATLVDPNDLRATISEPKALKVHGDYVNVKGSRFEDKALARWSGEKVIVFVPKYHAFNEVRVEDVKGNFICNAYSETLYSPLDKRGAKASFERKKNFNNSIVKLDRETPNIDVGAKLIDFAARQPDASTNQPIGTVSVTRSERSPITLRPQSKTAEQPISIEEQERQNAEEIAFMEEITEMVRQNNQGNQHD